MSDVHDRITALAQRIRAEMLAGSTLDDVLRVLRTEEELGSVLVIAAVRELGQMRLNTAKVMVSNFCEGRSYAHLTLADLDLLGDTPRVAGVDFFTTCHRDDAIIDRKPYLLYVRNRKSSRSVLIFTSSTPLAEPPVVPDGQHAGSVSGDSITFESVCATARTAAAAWPTEIAILRDDPDELLLHFLRAPAR